MYCPGCSTQAIDGAKFCKTCGMNLSVITQALTGGVVVADPLRDREFKRARKQISDGIQGTAIGAALLIAATLAYFLIPRNSYVYVLALGLALAGFIKLFRSIGGIIDAKVGPKMVDPALQTRGTGGLSAPLPSLAASSGVRPSQRLSLDSNKASSSPAANTRPVSAERDAGFSAHLPVAPIENAARPGTGRINREHSTQLGKLKRDEDLISKLRN